MALARVAGSETLPGEGAGAGQRMAPVALAHAAFAAEVVVAQGQREQAVVAQPVVVGDVLLAEREPEQALGQQALEGMLAAAQIPMIDKTGGQAAGQADALVDGAQQQGVAIAGHAAAVEAGAQLAAALIGQIDCNTVCGYGVCCLVALNMLITNMLSSIHTPCLPLW